MKLYLGLAAVIFGCIGCILGDDQFLCCMKGIKSVRNIAVCPAPCCYGYEERTVYATVISRITFCEKEKEEIQQSIEENAHLEHP